MGDLRESSQMSTPPTVTYAYYRQLCEHAGIAFISTGTDLTIRTWNAAASQMFGGSASNMVGTHIGSIIPGQERERGERLIRQAIETGEVLSFEFEHRDDQGRSRHLIATFSPIVDDTPSTIGALACIRDITRRITLEAELAQRDKMASLGQMAGTLAHYFNNILGGVVTGVDFALSTGDHELQSRALRQTGSALTRATKLLDALLAFAEGDVRHRDECDLTEVIIDVANYMEPELASHRIQLKLQLDPIPVTPVPRAQLVTVLENVLHNAADALPDGGDVIIVSSVSGGMVKLAVTDNGCGMDEATCQRIFEPFYSTKTSGLESDQHSGLGLAVAHGVLQVLGHTITVSSTIGVGTTVTIKFSGAPEPQI